MIYMGIIKNIKNAFFWGKIEHTAGRAMGLAIMLTLFVTFYGTILQVKILISATTILYWTYLLAHNVEKFLFNGRGPRSGWGKKKD